MLLATLLLVAPGAVSGAATPASPLLPPDHWAVKAAERLEEVGLLERYLPAQRSVPLLEVARALAEGEARARRVRPELSPLIAAWRERLREEWSGAEGEPRGARLLGAQLGLGVEGGAAHPTPAGPPPRSALFLEAPRVAPFVEGAGGAAYGGHLAAGLRGRATPWRARLASAELVGALGPVTLSVGRGQVGYGPNEYGGVVATGAASMDRVELFTAPLRLPGPLRVLGDFAFDTALARFSEPRHPYHPLLWQFQLQWRPHSRLTLAIIRGVMFGGALWDGIPTGQIPLALLGLKNYRENNLYSVSVRYRLPTEALLPLTARLEWGSDDNPGAWATWPGLVVGLTAPMLPRLQASLGVEYAYFGDGPVGWHPPFPWYGHGQYTGGWATGQTPLGDPLGGNGWALRLVGSADPFGGRTRLSAVAWVQKREQDNLYAPSAGGTSAGIRGEAELRFRRGAVGVRGSYERGQGGWSRSEVAGTGTVYF